VKEGSFDGYVIGGGKETICQQACPPSAAASSVHSPVYFPQRIANVIYRAVHR
jgi:hypothetical protein